MPYSIFLWVALGGAIGSVGRFAFGMLEIKLWNASIPWATVIINVIGSFVIGLVNAATLPSGPLPMGTDFRLFVMVGICGGFTTFSSFSLQTLQLLRDGDWLAAILNVTLSVTLCMIAVALGHWLGSRAGL